MTAALTGGGGGGNPGIGGNAASFSVTFWSDGLTPFTAQSATGGFADSLESNAGGGGGGASAIYLGNGDGSIDAVIAVAGGGGGGGAS